MLASGSWSSCQPYCSCLERCSVVMSHTVSGALWCLDCSKVAIHWIGRWSWAKMLHATQRPEFHRDGRENHQLNLWISYSEITAIAASVCKWKWPSKINCSWRRWSFLQIVAMLICGQCPAPWLNSCREHANEQKWKEVSISKTSLL